MERFEKDQRRHEVSIRTFSSSEVKISSSSFKISSLLHSLNHHFWHLLFIRIMHFSGISLASILAISPIVHALPAVPSKVSTAASEFVSAVCTAPSKQFNAVELDIASQFCSGFLHVKTATVSGD
jgi:hypothetical protein